MNKDIDTIKQRLIALMVDTPASNISLCGTGIYFHKEKGVCYKIRLDFKSPRAVELIWSDQGGFWYGVFVDGMGNRIDLKGSAPVWGMISENLDKAISDENFWTEWAGLKVGEAKAGKMPSAIHWMTVEALERLKAGLEPNYVEGGPGPDSGLTVEWVRRACEEMEGTAAALRKLHSI